MEKTSWGSMKERAKNKITSEVGSNSIGSGTRACDRCVSVRGGASGRAQDTTCTGHDVHGTRRAHPFDVNFVF